MRSRKKLLIIIFSLLGALLLAAGVSAIVLKVRPEWKYRLKTEYIRITSSAKLKETKALSLRDYGYDEFVSDSRVITDQSMALINSDHLIDFEPDVVEYKDSGVLMNSCLCDPYAALSSYIGESYGTKLYIMSSYRTAEEQAQEVINQGAIAAAVGASEHQAGLALDVYVPYYAGNAFIKTEEGQYVSSDGWRYGFIIRYPYYAVGETGIAYEPWHIRYVGAPHAEIITKSCLSLEKYIESIEPGKFYTYGGYTVTKQKGETLSLPDEFESAVISPDNCGNYIITLKNK